MLSFNLRYGKTDPKLVDVKAYILKLSSNIALSSERDLIKTLIFKKTALHSVKCMPVDYTWEIDPDFEPVIKAMIKISGVCFALSSVRFEDRNSLFIINHIKFIRNILKSGLILLGCKNPPTDKGVGGMNISDLRKDTLLEIARQVNDEMMQ
jgi:hypothetical protein